MVLENFVDSDKSLIYNVEGKVLKRRPEIRKKWGNWQLPRVWQAVNITLSH